MDAWALAESRLSGFMTVRRMRAVRRSLQRGPSARLPHESLGGFLLRRELFACETTVRLEMRPGDSLATADELMIQGDVRVVDRELLVDRHVGFFFVCELRRVFLVPIQLFTVVGRSNPRATIFESGWSTLN